MNAQRLHDALPPDWQPWLTALLLLVIGAALLEALVLHRRRRYDWRALAATLGDVAGRRVLEVVGGAALVAPLFDWIWQHRLQTLALDGVLPALGLFVGLEFCYYWHHRASHRVRWLWASHLVHHSPNELTLAAALRLGWTGRITGGALFFAPLVWLGYPPLAVGGALAANLLYQFWLHAPWLPRLGPLEWMFNTPAHHRVHHASNPEYLDCNYGGVLIVFDRLFGTFVAERADLPPHYGLSTPLRSYNPLRIALHGWLMLARDLRQVHSLPALLRTLFGPPAAGQTQPRSPSP